MLPMPQWHMLWTQLGMPTASKGVKAHAALPIKKRCPLQQTDTPDSMPLVNNSYQAGKGQAAMHTAHQMPHAPCRPGGLHTTAPPEVVKNLQATHIAATHTQNISDAMMHSMQGSVAQRCVPPTYRTAWPLRSTCIRCSAAHDKNAPTS